MSAALTDPPEIALYVHWPFCRARCPYCDFNVHVRRTVDHDAWRRALLAELDHFAARTPGRRLTSIFFGGGTPSLMAPATIAAVIERASTRWQGAPDIEIGLEANPNDRAAFRPLAEAGINRLSLGVQSFDDRVLRFLGRDHDANEAREALDQAFAVFSTVSFDLIYAWPEQSEESWRAELAEALTRARDQLSLYQLTIEPGTVFDALRRRGALRPASGDAAGPLYEIAQDMTAASGLPGYEISNHARPGRECRHNLVYWRYGDYAGIGPGAHGRLTEGEIKRATRQLRSPERWLAATQAEGHGTAESENLGAAARAQEMLIMGLRLAEGIARADIRRETKSELGEVVNMDAVAELIEAGLLALDAERIGATAAGRQRLDAVLERLLA